MAFAGVVAVFAARPPFAVEDLWAWRSAADPRITSDGEWVVYVEGWNDRPGDARFCNLWAVASNGKTRKQLTQGNWRDSSPRWSPDNTRLAWISDRTGKPQIWSRGLESGAEKQITTVENPPRSLAWSPDGERIAFTALVPRRPATPAWAPPAILSRLDQGREGYVHIFVTPAVGGAARQVSSGDFDDTGEPAWTPDGKSILTSRDDGQIYSIRIADGAARQMTPQGGRNENPVLASDSGRIAWLCAEDKAPSHGVRKICVMNGDGSRDKVLSGSLDRDARDPQWSSDSRTVYFVADDRGSTHVYAARNDGTVRQVTTAPERLSDFSLADNGRAVAVRSTPADSGGIFTFTVDRVSQPAILASPNEHLLAEREIGAAEEIAFPSAGNTIQAWVVKPPGFDTAKKYPLLLDIRDDPRAMYGVDFRLRAQILAARGFVVLCVNPRGTPGYGEVFGNLLRTRNPGDDFDDLMRGVDFVLSKGYIDSRRVTVAGGILAAWAIGHTDRFQAAVVRHPAGESAVRPWEEPEQYVKHSPVFFAQHFKTPTLVMTVDRDAAAEELYQALQARNVESAMLRLGAGKPGEWIVELEATAGWLLK
jgi:acylaminoacyl-peptidase